MNSLTILKSIIVLIAFSALTACGGSSDSIFLPVGTFFKTYNIDDSGNSSFPFSDSQDAKVQLLYTAAEINGSGNLTALRFRRDADTGQVTCPNTTIRLSHTNLTALTATFANNVERGQGSLVTVLDNMAVTIPAGSAGEWFEVPLSTPFAYSGVDNLVIEMEQFTVCSARVRMDISFPVTDRSASASAIDTTPGMADHDQTTGTVTSALNWIQFMFTGGDNYIDTPVGGLGTGNSYPFNTSPSTGRKVQLLYSASDINGSGPITGIGFPVGELTTDQTYVVTIKLGHSTLTEFVDGSFADSYTDNPVTVATDLTFTVPAGVPQGGIVWMPVTGSFNYNGTDNLILEVETTDNSLATDATRWWARTSTGSNNRLSGNLGSSSGTAGSNYYFTKFRFNGSTMDVGLPGIAGVNLVFDATVDGAVIQNLYRPVDLGTGGLIDSIGVRLANDSVAAVHSNYTIRMGHTANTALNPIDTFASNMDEDLTVYSGSFSIPAGLKAGDWVTIPLSTGFNYDPTQNLVILFSTSGGAASANDVQIAGGLRFLSGVSGSAAGSDAIPALGTENGVVVTRLHIHK
ncbi:MAG: hypothetical protein ACC641_08125 [Acidiferrobacterales bacterium]